MDDIKRIRYDFFGENFSQETTHQNGDKPPNDVTLYNNPCIPPGQTTVPEDSLMEFITDYFQGSVDEDFTDTTERIQLPATVQDRSHIKRPHQISAFDLSINSNNSSEIFTSPDTSLMHGADQGHNNLDNSDGICDADLSSPPAPSENQYPNSSRRKSISYEIVFTNTKEKNGPLKIHIVPNKKFPSFTNPAPVSFPNDPVQKGSFDQTRGQPVQQENVWLRQRVLELEKKFHCLEMESSRVIGELSRIIERKNETISQLELQIAGVRIKNVTN